MQNNYFYQGVLAELEKIALFGGTNAPVTGPVQPAAPTQPAAPAGPSLMQRATGYAGRKAGAGLGAYDNFMMQHFGRSGVHDAMTNVADKATATGSMPSGKFMSAFGPAALRHDTSLVNTINDPTRAGSLGAKTHGFYQIDPKTGKPGLSLGTGLKTIAGQAENWMGQHPWLTGIGGGLALTGLLASALRSRRNDENQRININVTGQNQNAAPAKTAPSFF